MGLPNQNMSLVLSTDAKPRLKWTPELHQRFVDAVNQLGGADKATPKGLMRVMGISGLTLYHLKSHLQKFRLGKSQQPLTSIENKKEVIIEADYKEVQTNSDVQFSQGISEGSHDQNNESLRVAQALQLQMEVQRKLHEQIEVQRHLQLRIEAQGKYLQSVLKKAQETLSGYNSSSVGIELARAELSKLVSMVNNGCPSSSVSELTEVGGSSLTDTERKQFRSTVCSMESSLTSSESSGRKEEMQQKNETNVSKLASIELPLMDIHPQNKPCNSGSSSEVKKRNGSTISDNVYLEKPQAKRSKNNEKVLKSELLGTFDLNTQYQYDTETASKAVDLNFKGIEQVNG